MAEKGLHGRDDREGSREMAEEYPGETGCWLYRCAHAEVRTGGGPHTQRCAHAEVHTRRGAHTRRCAHADAQRRRLMPACFSTG